MKVSWWQLLKAAPEVKGTVATVEGNKDWYKSQSILYQLIKTGVTLLSALGLYGAMSAEDMQTISTALAVAIPAVLTLCDGVAAIWIRLRTSGAITGTVEAAKVAEIVAERKVESCDAEQQGDG